MEKNKVWLLPLLGVGVLAVAYLNLRGTPAAPAASEPPAPEPLAAQAGAPVAPAAPAAPGASTSPGLPGDLWSDLLALAAPPANLAEEAPLRERARENLDALLGPTPTLSLPHPGKVREAQPVLAAQPEAAAPRPQAQAPLVEFILSDADGYQAWFQGRPYHAGQVLAGGDFTLQALRWNQVTLKDRQGRISSQFTRPSHRPVGGVRPTVEAP